MSNQPKLKFKDGLVSVTVWENKTDEGKAFYSVDLKRSYQKDEQWHETTSINKNDLPRASALMNMAYQKIIELENQ